LGKKDAEDIWNLIVKFAGYGFNKSHSTAYALIAYQTAYLKSHYPVEFMAALLSGDIPGRNFKKKDALVEHMEDCERMGIEVVPPDVNHSNVDFSVAEKNIYFALSAVKGCGGGAADAIEAERKANGPFLDLFDFCERIDPHACNRATIETLIKAGAFDSFGAKRSQLLAVVDRALQAGSAALADRKSGQKSLFGDIDEPEVATPPVTLPEIPEIEEREKLLMEKEVLGFYLTSHPLEEHREAFETYCSHSTADLGDLPDRAEVTIGGMISSIKMAHVRKVRPGSNATKYANFDLEDVHGAVRCILWPDDFAVYGEFVQADAILAIRAVVDRRGGSDEINMIVNELIPIDQLGARYTRGLALRVHETEQGEKGLSQLREILRGYPGDCEVQLVLCLSDGSRIQLRCGNTRVEVNRELRARIEDLIGATNIRVLTSNGGRKRAAASR
jgi:DNA polymerase III subunit alpha